MLGWKGFTRQRKTFLWPPRKEFLKNTATFFQSKEKILSLTQALDIICMHGYGHICIAIDMPAKYHTQALGYHSSGCDTLYTYQPPFSITRLSGEHFSTGLALNQV